MYLMEIRTSPYLRGIITPQPPAKITGWRGPYKQRKLKRWARLHPAYYESYLLGGRTIVCHPSAVNAIRELLATLTPPDASG